MNQTVIVFSEDCILAASGREGKYPALSGVKKIGLQMQGDSFERWGQALKELPQEWKTGQAHLVLPVSMCSSRVLKLPYAKGKQLADMASKEMADSFRNEVADYSIVSEDKKNGVDICVGGVDSGQLDSFCSICADAGIAVGSMSIPMEGYLHILQQLDSYYNRTAIYLFFEEGSMMSVLCQDGRYLYSGRSRLFSEPGTLDFGTEIVRSVSGILQFYASEKRENPITDVYYVGCPAGDFEVSVEGIENMNLKTAPMAVSEKISVPPGQKAADWIPCIGAMMKNSRAEKRIDLYRANKKFSEKGEKQQGIGKHLLFPAAVFILCMIPTIIFFILNRITLNEIQKKQEWIASEEVQSQYNQAMDLERQLADIESSIAAVELTSQNLSVYPELSNDILRQIENAGGAGIECRITGYDASTGVLTFQAESRKVIDVPDYILKLKDSGLFHTVNYTGYDYDNEWYTLSLSCAMEGKISKQAQEQGITWETKETQGGTQGADEAQTQAGQEAGSQDGAAVQEADGSQDGGIAEEAGGSQDAEGQLPEGGTQ